MHLKRADLLWWLVPFLAGAVIGAVSSGVNHLIYFAWGIFYADAVKAPTLFIIFSVTGLTLSYFLVHLLAWYRTLKSSFHTILEAIHLNPQGITLREASVKAASAVSTAIFGGSAGPEGPSALIGGGLSTWISRKLRLGIEARRALLIGVASGISASFKAPLTGALFALEFPYRRDLEMEPFIDAAMASSSAYLVSVALNSPSLLPNLQLNVSSVPMALIPISMAFGLITSGVVGMFTRAYHLAEMLSRRMLSKGGYPLMILLGSIVIGLAGYLSPNSIGPGYQMAPMLVSAASTLLIVLLLRLVSTIFTVNFGGSGGLLLPTLLMGGAWGAIVSSVFEPGLLPAFVLMGMASFSSGVHKTMLTPIIFVAETFGADAMIPVILATVVCYFAVGSSVFYHTQPLTKVDKEELALERFYYKVARAMPKELAKLTTADVMTANPKSLRSKMTVREAFEEFSKTPFRLMPVVDDGGGLMGYVKLEELATLTKISLDETLDVVGMHRPLVFDEKKAVVDVIREMIEGEVDHAFVVGERRQLKGIISGIDLVMILLRYYTHI